MYWHICERPTKVGDVDPIREGDITFRMHLPPNGPFSVIGANFIEVLSISLMTRPIRRNVGI